MGIIDLSTKVLEATLGDMFHDKYLVYKNAYTRGDAYVAEQRAKAARKAKKCKPEKSRPRLSV